MSQHKLGMSSFGGQLAPGPSSASLAPQGSGAYAPSRGDTGASFVMGGSPLGRVPLSSGSSRGGERYDSGLRTGEMGTTKSGGGGCDYHRTSLASAVLGKHGQKILFGLFVYGFGLIAIGYVIVTMFGGNSEMEYYSRPTGMDESVRPLWDR